MKTFEEQMREAKKRMEKLCAANARAREEKLTTEDITERFMKAEDMRKEFKEIAAWIRDNTEGIETEVFTSNLKHAETQYLIQKDKERKGAFKRFGSYTCTGC